MCSRCHVGSGSFTLLCYVSHHVIRITQRVAKIVEFYVKYLVFLQNILAENSYFLKRIIIPLTVRCSMGL
jgi:hypothetical protein